MATENTPIKTAQDSAKAPPVNPDAKKPVGEPQPEHGPEKKAEQGTVTESTRK